MPTRRKVIPLWAALKSFFTENLYPLLRFARRLEGAQRPLISVCTTASRTTLYSNPSRLLRRARRALEEGELAKAERLYTECLQHQANSFDALHGLGQIHQRRGRLDTALVCFQEA